MSDKTDKYVIQAVCPEYLGFYCLHPDSNVTGGYLVNAGLVGCAVWDLKRGTKLVEYLKPSFNNVKLVPFSEAVELVKKSIN